MCQKDEAVVDEEAQPVSPVDERIFGQLHRGEQSNQAADHSKRAADSA